MSDKTLILFGIEILQAGKIDLIRNPAHFEYSCLGILN